MDRSIERFNHTREGALRSFIIPLILLPLTLTILFIKPGEYPPELMVTIHALRFIISFGLFIAVVYYLSLRLNCSDRFYAFVCANNWIGVIQFVFLIPCIVFLLMNPDQWAAISSYAIFITIYSYVLLAYVVKCSLRLNWYLGGFIAIIGLGIDQTVLDIANIIRDSLI